MVDMKYGLDMRVTKVTNHLTFENEKNIQVHTLYMCELSAFN